jgi:hypothetical protein
MKSTRCRDAVARFRSYLASSKKEAPIGSNDRLHPQQLRPALLGSLGHARSRLLGKKPLHKNVPPDGGRIAERIAQEDIMNTARTSGSLLLCMFVAATSAAGDPLTDLRAVLHRYPAMQRFSASASVDVKGDANDDGSRAGSTTFEVESGGRAGFVIRVLPEALGAAGREAGAMLLNELNGATLLEQTSSAHAGKPAMMLRIKVKPTLASTHSRLVKEPVIELRIWFDANGVPIVAERDSNYSASLVVVRAANVRKERWQLAVAGDRLYASQTNEENRASAAGRSVVSYRSVMYAPK